MARIVGNGTDGESRQGSSAGHLALEVAAQQAALLGKLREQMPDADVDAFAGAAQRLAEAFGAVTAAALDPLVGAAGTVEASASPASAASAPASAPLAKAPRAFPPPVASPSPPSKPAAPASEPAAPASETAAPAAKTLEFPQPETHPSLYRHGHMRRRLDQLLEMNRRYGHSFCLAVFDVAGPATRNGAGGGAEGALTVVGHALRANVRLVDETYRLEEDALCVLGPNQDTVGGVQMSERLLASLAALEAAGGLPIEITSGVVACPEHGTEADALLHNADEAMWRARSVGQPVGVGRLISP